MKTAAQLVITMLGLGLVVAIVIGGWSAWSAFKALNNNIKVHCTAITDNRTDQVKKWYGERIGDIGVFSVSADAKAMFAAASANVQSMKVGAQDPVPVDTPGYKQLAQRGACLTQFKKDYGYYDVFITDGACGHVI